MNMAFLASLLVSLHLAAVVAAELLPFEAWHHQRIITEDVQLHVRWAGSGPPLMLIHGFPQHSVNSPLPRSHLTRIDTDFVYNS
jgi:hypothetical protein